MKESTCEKFVPPTDRKNIVLFLTSPGIGDFINSVPAIRILRKRYPKSKILGIVKVDSRYRDLVALLPELDEVRLIDTRKGGIKTKLDPKRNIMNLRAFVAISSQKAFAAVLINFKNVYCVWAWLSRIPIRICSPKKLGITHEAATDGVSHIYDYYYKFVSPICGELDGERLADYARMTLSENIAKQGREYVARATQSKTVFINLCGTLMDLHWGFDKYLELTRRLAKHFNIIIASDAYESEIFDKYSVEIEAIPTVRWETNKSLLEKSGIIKNCDLLIGGSTGLTHISHALGVPVLAIFAESNLLWHPIGEYAVTLCKKTPEGWATRDEETRRSGYVRDIPLDAVYDTAMKILSGDAELNAAYDTVIYC